jgi:hypothetical protein
MCFETFIAAEKQGWHEDADHIAPGALRVVPATLDLLKNPFRTATGLDAPMPSLVYAGR